MRAAPTAIRVLGAAAGLALVAGLAAGCAGPAPAASTSPIPLMPAADPFVSAVVFTNGLGTADLEITNTVQVGPTTTTRTGDIAAAMDAHGYGSGIWDDGGTRVEELVGDKAVYVRPAGSKALWTKHPDGTRTLNSKLIAPLAGLGELMDLRDEGVTTQDGTPLRRYTGRLSATPERLRALGLTDDDLALLGDQASAGTIAVVAWVDDRNQIVRVDRSFEATAPDGTPVRASIVTRLTEFTVDLDLQAPSSADVTALPTSASGSSSGSSSGS